MLHLLEEVNPEIIPGIYFSRDYTTECNKANQNLEKGFEGKDEKENK